MRRRQDYAERVNRALDYVSRHPAGDVSLARLARVAGFSRFHFHRIFQGVTGETVNAHVRRVRLERAVRLLRASPRKRITDVALESGFAGSAEFSRAFRNHFARTASSWDRRSPLENSKIGKAPGELSFDTIEELRRWSAASGVRVGVHRIGAFRYVYCRTFAAHGNTQLVERYHAMIDWLARRGTDVRDVVIIGMSLDDPAITPPENIRYDLGAAFSLQPDGLLAEIVRARGPRAAALIAPPTRAECRRAQLSVRDFAPHESAAFHVVGDLAVAGRAWQYLYRVWLPASRFEAADLPAMEMFVRLPEDIGWETFDLHACIPVARL